MGAFRHFINMVLALSLATVDSALLRSTVRSRELIELDFERMALSRLEEGAARFDLCWDRELKSWSETSACSHSISAQQQFLCHQWLVGSCVAQEHPRCAEVSEMCQSLQAKTSGMVLQGVSHRPLNFIHIPKNAGTAVEEAGQVSGVQWGRYSMNGLQRMADNNLCVKWHVPPQFLEDEGMLQAYEQSEGFCVVRHPYDRAVSEYLYLLGVPWGTNFSEHLLEKPGCTEEGLNNFLQSEMALMDSSPFRLDCHMLPQAHYIWGPDGHQFCDNVLHMEELPTPFNALMESAGVEVHMNASIVNGAGRCGDNISISSLWASTKDMMHKAYVEDFRKLGFAKY